MKSLMIAAAAALSLAACATGGGGTQNWPAPQTLQSGLLIVEAGWTAYCGEAKNPVCKQNQQKVADADKTATDAITAYTEAYNSGNVTQALLDNANALIADVAAILADTKKRK